MFKHKWAAIVYGRSYHLDFRFITIPEDFTEPEINWAANYILATFRQANKLSLQPRWSLFKNESHCVLGVTCMVRDLLKHREREVIEEFSKDDLGRPLYVFVGYVTQLERQKSLANFPPYTDRSLQSFQSLYQYISEVWWVKEYYENSKKPIFNDYQTLDFPNKETHNIFELAGQINHQEKYPHQTYIWQNTLEQKQKLWVTSAVCYKPISVCLGEQNLKQILNSPFLNQTIITESSAVIKGCAIDKIERNRGKAFNRPETLSQQKLSQVINNKIKEDIELTLHHAKIIINKSRNFLRRNSDRSPPSFQPYTPKRDRQNDNFGFKPPSKAQSDREWF